MELDRGGVFFKQDRNCKSLVRQYNVSVRGACPVTSLILSQFTRTLSYFTIIRKLDDN